MVKWPFETVQWLPKGWTGHFEKYIVLKVCHITCFKKEHQPVASTGYPRLFFWGGRDSLIFQGVFISSTGVNFHWLEARARWIGFERISTTDLVGLVLTPSSTKYIAVVFFPLYIIHMYFFQKKNETRDFVLNHTFPRITVQVNKF